MFEEIVLINELYSVSSDTVKLYGQRPKPRDRIDLRSTVIRLNEMKSLLIVEDNDDLRVTLQLRFEAAGFAVSVAEHGLDALKSLATQMVDVVLTDVEMPTMNGMEFLKQAKLLYSNLPIVVMSGGSVYQPEDFVRAGASTFVAKTDLHKFEIRRFLPLKTA